MVKEKEYEHIYVEMVLEKSYAVINMNRPQRLNAIQTQTMQEIAEALETMEFDKKVRCVVLGGLKIIQKSLLFQLVLIYQGRKCLGDLK